MWRSGGPSRPGSSTTSNGDAGPGSKGGRVYRTANDPNKLVVLLEWQTADKAHEFVASLELNEWMQWSTSNVATPRVTVVEAAFDSEA